MTVYWVTNIIWNNPFETRKSFLEIQLQAIFYSYNTIYVKKMNDFSKKYINIPRGAYKLHPSQLRRDGYLSRWLLYTSTIIILLYKNQNTACVYTLYYHYCYYYYYYNYAFVSIYHKIGFQMRTLRDIIYNILMYVLPIKQSLVWRRITTRIMGCGLRSAASCLSVCVYTRECVVYRPQLRQLLIHGPREGGRRFNRYKYIHVLTYIIYIYTCGGLIMVYNILLSLELFRRRGRIGRLAEPVKSLY